MIPKPKLYARVKGGGWRAVEFDQKDGYSLPPMLWNPPLTAADITSYCVRVNGKYISASRRKVLSEAMAELRRMQADPSGAAPAFVAELALDVPAERGLLATAATKYIAQLSAFGKAKATIEKYSHAVNDFVTVCTERGTLMVDKITREDLIAYLTWLRKEENVPRRQFGSRDTTLANRMRFLGTFLFTVGIKMKRDRNARPGDTGLLALNEIPKAPKTKGEKFSKETIQAMLKVATADETDLLQFFLFTGFRDDEAAHCEWSDFNFDAGTINVHEKPNWKPKDKESREQDIPLPPKFVQRMKDRRERQNGTLVFPSSVNTPDTHLILIIQRLATRAGIEGRITLHAFRRTFGSEMARKCGSEMARQFLGHSDLETTSRYMVTDQEDVERARAGAAETFAEYTLGV